MSHIHIHTQFPTKANPYVVHAVLWDKDNSPVIDKTLRRRGINRFVSASRPMTLDELERYKTIWRIYTYRYQTWEGLIEDEWMLTGDKIWVLRLYEESKLQIPLSTVVPGL